MTSPIPTRRPQVACPLRSRGRPKPANLLHLRSTTPLVQLNKNTLLRVIPPWHLYILLLANPLAFYLTYFLTFDLAYLLAFYLAYLLADVLAYLLAFHLAFYLAYLLVFYLTFYLAFYLAYLLAFYLAYLLTFRLAYLLAFYLAVEVQRCTLSWAGPRLRSSCAHWAGKVPGWGPAVHTELGRSQVEVQQCALSWEVGKELGAESRRREVAKSWAKSWQGGSAGGSWCRHGRGETGGGGRGRGGRALW